MKIKIYKVITEQTPPPPLAEGGAKAFLGTLGKEFIKGLAIDKLMGTGKDKKGSEKAKEELADLIAKAVHARDDIEPMNIQGPQLEQHTQLLARIQNLLQSIGDGIAKLPQDPDVVGGSLGVGGEEEPEDKIRTEPKEKAPKLGAQIPSKKPYKVVSEIKIRVNNNLRLLS
jgi:hypothetical protein